eukprot:8592359-Heterocapsa_arctica.AAC.1
MDSAAMPPGGEMSGLRSCGGGPAARAFRTHMKAWLLSWIWTGGGSLGWSVRAFPRWPCGSNLEDDSFGRSEDRNHVTRLLDGDEDLGAVSLAVGDAGKFLRVGDDKPGG